MNNEIQENEIEDRNNINNVNYIDKLELFRNDYDLNENETNQLNGNGSYQEDNFHRQLENKFFYAPTIKEIKRVVTAKVFELGEEYQKLKTLRDFNFSENNELEAKCEEVVNSQISSFNAKIIFQQSQEEDESIITKVECTCSLAGKCKHVAACLIEWKEGTSIPYACEKNLSSTLILLIANKVHPNQLELEKKPTNKRKIQQLSDKMDFTDKFSGALEIAHKNNSESCVKILKDLFDGMLWNRERHVSFPTVQKDAIECFLLVVRDLQKSLTTQYVPYFLLNYIIQLSVDFYIRDETIKPPVEEEKCPICRKVYRSDKMICCYKCNKWIHYECDTLDEIKVMTLPRNVEYVCPDCRTDNEKFIKL